MAEPATTASPSRPSLELTLSLNSPVEIPSTRNYHQIYDPPINMQLLIDPHDGFAPDMEYLIGVSEITVAYAHGDDQATAKAYMDRKETGFTI